MKAVDSTDIKLGKGDAAIVFKAGGVENGDYEFYLPTDDTPEVADEGIIIASAIAYALGTKNKACLNALMTIVDEFYKDIGRFAKDKK